MNELWVFGMSDSLFEVETYMGLWDKDYACLTLDLTVAFEFHENWLCGAAYVAAFVYENY